MARLDELASELYAGPPGEFVARRDEQARLAREAGDAALARGLRALRRPTQSAWAVNQLSAHRPGLIAQLLELGTDFRRDQLSRSQLQQLSTQRRTLLNQLLAEAQALATAAGVNLTAEMYREVEATLHAAIADPGSADAVRGGRLTKPLSYTGFGPELVLVPEPLAAVGGGAGKPAAPPDRDAALREAEDELRTREDALEAAIGHRDQLAAQRADLAERLEALRDQLSLLEKDLATAERAVKMESRRSERARKALDAHLPRR